MSDLDQHLTIRSQTPGTSHVIHFNNAGCSLPSKKTLESVVSYLQDEALMGGYETFEKYATILNEKLYQSFATLLNCDPAEIAIMSSATDAWQQIIYGLAWQRSWTEDSVIVTCQHEYGSNYIAYLQIAKRTGARIDVIPDTPEGDICLQSLKNILQSKHVVLISLSHVSTSSGRVYDASGVGHLAHKYNVPFLLDACQSVGHFPVDVQKIRCTFLTGTGRKYLRAPRGTGFLYVSKKSLSSSHQESGASSIVPDGWEPATLDNTGATWTSRNDYEMSPTAKRFERYEMSFAARYGLYTAVQQCLDMGVESIWHRIDHLAQYMRQLLSSTVPQLSVMDHGVVLCGIVSFVLHGHDADVVRNYLMNEKKINTSVSRCTSTRIDFEERQLSQVLRVSVHYFNTEEEVDCLVRALVEFVKLHEVQ